MNISEQIINLYNDKNYKELKSYYSRETLFDILGIARVEAAHSNFLAWILNPNASHNMGVEPLRKFIRLLYQASTTKPNKHENFPCELITPIVADTYILKDTNVTLEKTTDKGKKSKRMDIYIKTRIQLDTMSEKMLQIIIENKVDSAEHDSQTKEYYTWGEKQCKQDDILLAVYLTPNLSKPCADEHYLMINYQQLTDKVLYPLGNITKSPMAQFLLDEYLRNLGRTPLQDETTKTKRTIMAIGPNEKELIRNFYNSNQELIMAIVNVLANDEEVALEDNQREVLRNIDASTLHNRDSNNYRYNGKLYTAHTELVRMVFKDYAREKNISLSEFCRSWGLKKKQYLNREEYESKIQARDINYPFDKKINDSDWIVLNDDAIIISCNWPLKVNSVDADFAIFLERARTLEITIEPVPKTNQ